MGNMRAAQLAKREEMFLTWTSLNLAGSSAKHPGPNIAANPSRPRDTWECQTPALRNCSPNAQRCGTAQE